MLEHLPGHFEPTLQKPYAFETRWRAASPPLRTAIDNLTAVLTSKESRKRNRKASDQEKFKRAVEAICCNLLAITLAPEPLRPLMVMRGSYASGIAPVYGVHFRNALRLMEDLDIITTDIGGKFIGKDTRAPSTIKATAKIAEYLPCIDDWSVLRLEDESTGSIIIKDKKDDAQADAEWMERVENEMSRINVMVQSERVTIKGNVVNEVDLSKRSAITLHTPHHRTLRRIFNGNHQSGGRLYGGFWQNLPKDKRGLIRIDGEPVVNVDYGQLYLHLAYADAAKRSPPGDLYDLTGKDHLRDDWPVLRQGRKVMVNALFFARKPMKQWPGDFHNHHALRACFPPDKKARDAVADIKQRHAAIAADWFEQGRGLELMRRESDILVAVLLRLIALGIIALPIHDSVIVRQDLAEDVRQIMQEEAPEIPVKIDEL